MTFTPNYPVMTFSSAHNVLFEYRQTGRPAHYVLGKLNAKFPDWIYTEGPHLSYYATSKDMEAYPVYELSEVLDESLYPYIGITQDLAIKYVGNRSYIREQLSYYMEVKKRLQCGISLLLRHLYELSVKFNDQDETDEDRTNAQTEYETIVGYNYAAQADFDAKIDELVDAHVVPALTDLNAIKERLVDQLERFGGDYLKWILPYIPVDTSTQETAVREGVIRAVREYTIQILRATTETEANTAYNSAVAEIEENRVGAAPRWKLTGPGTQTGLITS